MHLGAAVWSARFPVFLACASNPRRMCRAQSLTLRRGALFRTLPLDSPRRAAPVLGSTASICHFGASRPRQSTPRHLKPRRTALSCSVRPESHPVRVASCSQQCRNSAVPRLRGSLLWSHLTERGRPGRLATGAIAGPLHRRADAPRRAWRLNRHDSGPQAHCWSPFRAGTESPVAPISLRDCCDCLDSPEGVVPTSSCSGLPLGFVPACLLSTLPHSPSLT